MDIDIVEKNGNRFFEFQATGTKWVVVFDPLSIPKEGEVFEIIQKIVPSFENNYSRFIDTSFVKQLEKTGVIKSPPQVLQYMIKLGRELETVTNGAFNLAIGSVLESRGYDKQYSFTKKDSVIKKDDWFLNLNSELLQIKQGVVLDFGSFGKGYLVDILCEALQKLNPQSLLINAGGDIRYLSKNNEKKVFFLENPFDYTEFIGKIAIEDAGIASSSNNRRKWHDKKTGELFTHIVSFTDDNLNQEKEIAAIYTHASTTVIADALATVLFLLNDQKSQQTIAQKYSVEYLIIYSDGTFYKSEYYPGVLNNN